MLQLAWLVPPLVSLVASIGTEEAKLVPLCDVLAGLQEYNGKTVRIRGEVMIGREAFYLQDATCREGQKTGDYTWEPAIWLEAPHDELSLAPGRRVDRPAFAQFWGEVDRVTMSHGRWPSITATVTGTVRAKKDLGAVRSATGQWLTNGFGHLNVFPAVLVTESIAEWAITPAATAPRKP